MQVKTIVLLNHDERNMLDDAQILMNKYMEQLECIGDTESDVYKRAQEIFNSIEYFFTAYEKIDPDII